MRRCGSVGGFVERVGAALTGRACSSLDGRKPPEPTEAGAARPTTPPGFNARAPRGGGGVKNRAMPPTAGSCARLAPEKSRGELAERRAGLPGKISGC